ncbi:MAG: glycosyltransferase [Candidatus Aenigmatarchaeota archaeon]
MKISVVVSTYNSENLLPRLLKSLVAQDYRNKEIIVVDDGSTDRTVEAAKKFKNVKVFSRKHMGPAAQRTFGAKAAKGDIVFFTDSDCVAPKGLLKGIAMNFQKHDIAGCGGTYKTLNKKSSVARFVGYEIGWRHSKQVGYTDFLGTYCCAYKRDIFLKFGGFNPTFKTASGEDPELSFKIFSGGHKLLFDKTLFVWHSHPNSLKKYLKQQFYRAYWRVSLYNKHPKKMGGDVYTGREIPYSPIMMAAFIFSLFSSAVMPVSAYLSVISIAAFFAIYLGFFNFVYKRERRMLPISIAIIFLRTISWLFGFAYGLKLLKK